jgi:L-rhamnose isomerase
MTRDRIREAYRAAQENYAQWGVDTEAALARLDRIEISMHAGRGTTSPVWSGGGRRIGGILSTGNYPYKPRNGDECARISRRRSG